jgi:hypothetical protein
MCHAKAEQTTFDHRFNPETKCCTYFPYLPNFLVGNIFRDEDPAMAEGRAAFIKVYEEGSAVITPLGVDPPLSYQQKYSPMNPGFGEHLEMRCPYYLEQKGGMCGIWKYRNSKCATWFCRYVKGQTGFEFWQSVDELLSTIQKGLSRWCMRQLDAGTAELQQAFAEPDITEPTVTNLTTAFQRQIFTSVSALLNKMQDKNALYGWQQQTWGKWLGREVEYFKECSKLIDPLHWQDVLNIVRGKTGNLAEGTQQTFRKLRNRELPEVLRLNSYRRVDLDDQRSRVWSYNRNHPLDLPRKVADSLCHFDGRSKDEVLQTIHLKEGFELDLDLLQKLFDHRILVEV